VAAAAAYPAINRCRLSSPLAAIACITIASTPAGALLQAMHYENVTAPFFPDDCFGRWRFNSFSSVGIVEIG
jgi:hypothetical protein